MPSFEGTTSRPSPAEADLLRGVLGPVRPRETTLRAASRAYHRSQRAVLRRAIAVCVLLGVFLGSASLMTQKHSSPAPALVAAERLQDPVTTGSIGAAKARAGGGQSALRDLQR